MTQRLRDAGQILVIRLLDHVIWTREGRYHSFAQSNPDSLISHLPRRAGYIPRLPVSYAFGS